MATDSDYGAGKWFRDHVMGSGITAKGAYNKKLFEDVDRMNQGQLGFSDAKKQQMKTGAVDDAVQAASAVGQDVAEVAGGDPQATKALMKGMKEAAEAGTNAQVAVEMASAQQAALEEERTVKALNEKRKEWNANVEDFLSEGLEGLGESVVDAGGFMAKIAPMLINFCWVAREVLPHQWRDCRTYILFGAPKWFRTWYVKNGEKTAGWIRRNPWARIALKPLFKYFAWRGRKMAESDPRLIEAQAHLL
tara:strand:- start:13351 stop:14097 length:747 start_codon:yes stop_codon:yes gene_type:complete